MRATVVHLVLLLLACAGITEPETTPDPIEPPDSTVSAPTGGQSDAGDWIPAAVEEALGAEVMPGTTEEPDRSRQAALTEFFGAHPEYADPARRSALWAHACGIGTEAAHEFITNPPPAEPVIQEVTAVDWKIFLIYADDYCTSDDFGYYAGEAYSAASSYGVQTTSGGPTNDVLVVMRGGTEEARVPLSGAGYLALRAGQEPLWIDYGPGDLENTLRTYFGTSGPTPDTFPQIKR